MSENSPFRFQHNGSATERQAAALWTGVRANEGLLDQLKKQNVLPKQPPKLEVKKEAPKEAPKEAAKEEPKPAPPPAPPARAKRKSGAVKKVKATIQSMIRDTPQKPREGVE